jgi:hypothetical protein
MTARNLGVVFGRTCRPPLCQFFSNLLFYSHIDRSYPNALPQSWGRIRRHGGQGDDHRMARRECAHNIPATVAVDSALILSNLRFEKFRSLILFPCCHSWLPSCLWCVYSAYILPLTYIPFSLFFLFYSDPMVIIAFGSRIVARIYPEDGPLGMCFMLNGPTSLPTRYPLRPPSKR